MLDVEYVPGRLCYLLQYSFRFDQIIGVERVDSTAKFVL